MTAPPPLLRRLMQDAVAKWASKPLVEALRGSAARKPIGQAYADVITLIQHSERQHTLKTYGPKHPEVARD